MVSNVGFILLAFLGGAVLPIQIGFNSNLRLSLGSAMQAAFVSFSVGALAALAVCIATRTPLPNAEKLATPAVWMWFGGCFGVFYVWTTIMTGPRIGAAFAISLAIAGQLIVAAMLDHNGALGFPQDSLSPIKMAGIGLVIAGVVLVGYAKQS